MAKVKRGYDEGEVETVEYWQLELVEEVEMHWADPDWFEFPKNDPRFTHWMPLPERPKLAKSGVQ